MNKSRENRIWHAIYQGGKIALMVLCCENTAPVFLLSAYNLKKEVAAGNDRLKNEESAKKVCHHRPRTIEK